VYKLPDNVSLKDASVIEPMAVGCYATKRADVKFGDDVVVIGGGAIGLGAMQMASLNGGNRCIMVEILDFRIKTAMEIGATHGINAKDENVVEKVMEITKGNGADKIIIAAAGSADVFKDSVKMLADGGTICVVGLSGGQMAQIDTDTLADKEGALVGSHSSPGIWTRLISMVETGKFKLAPIISHEFPLEKGPEAFEFLDKNIDKANKVVLKID
jgi:L-iditol 2-dehydrogenase